MPNLQNFRIGTRLGAGFAILLLLMAATMLLAGANMAAMNGRSEQIVNVEYRKVKLETTALDNTRGSIARVFQLVADDNKERQAQAKARLQANLKAVADALASLGPLLTRPDGKALHAKAAASQDRYVAAVDAVVGKLESGKRDDAARQAWGDAYTALHALAGDLRALLDFNQKVTDDAGAESTRGYESARASMIAAGLVTLALGALLAWAITRSITHPLREAVVVADRVAAGDLTSRIRSEGRDEVSRLLASLAAMNRNLAEIVGRVRGAAD